jgi:hypothetical protein
VQTTEFPENYPLVVLAIAGGRLAIGSPLWPVGANHAMKYSQIISINGQPCQFPETQSKQTKRRRSA